MEKIGSVEIRVIGKIGHLELKPEHYDIRHIASLLQYAEDLLHPNPIKNRPLISYDLEEGSVKHIFKTHMQYVIGLSAVLSQVQNLNSIEFLEPRTAKAIEGIQQLAREKDYEFQFKTSDKTDLLLSISPKTNFVREHRTWVEAEFYFYGILKDAGGKNKANIHLDTADYGYLAIETEQDFLMAQKENLLYKAVGVRAKGKQSLEQGEIDTKSLKLIDLIDYNPSFDLAYLQGLMAKAKESWIGLNTEDWLTEIRGSYEL